MQSDLESAGQVWRDGVSGSLDGGGLAQGSCQHSAGTGRPPIRGKLLRRCSASYHPILGEGERAGVLWIRYPVAGCVYTITLQDVMMHMYMSIRMVLSRRVHQPLLAGFCPFIAEHTSTAARIDTDLQLLGLLANKSGETERPPWVRRSPVPQA